MKTRWLIALTLLVSGLLAVDRPVHGFFHKKTGEAVGDAWEDVKKTVDDGYDRARDNADRGFDNATRTIDNLARATVQDIKNLRKATLDDLKKLRKATTDDIKSLRDATLRDIRRARDDARDFMVRTLLILGAIALVGGIVYAWIVVSYVRRRLPAKQPA